ncbi:MAG: amino acid permease [Candidatus Rifleibacteriota bacterium]
MSLISPVAQEARKFGTFGGVFTPSILTIFGVIMFMRANFVVGQAGIFSAVLILLIAKSITTLTTLSISAIATNMQVRGGGAYFMISRVLGPEFGGAIGLALFFAQALSVPFYLLGFSEAVMRTFPGHENLFLYINLASAVILFIVAYVGADWAIKTQYFIMAVLFSSIFVFLGGAFQSFSFSTLSKNMLAEYSSMETGGNYNFWVIFAIYFPAVTGILAGINMSGDLKNPGESIPTGTFMAVGVGFLVYLIQIVICGGAFLRADLIAQPYDILVNNALFGAGFLVTAGVYAATLSSALGSYLGAPRILQAVARDGIVENLRFFAHGEPGTDEPRRAIVLTGFITLGVVYWASGQTGGSALNIVASIITMFFLFTYGMVNIAAFTEAYSHNPSFRPRFRYFHWFLALAGAIGCIIAAFLIDARDASIAVLILFALYRYMRNKDLSMAFGDVRRGFIYTNVRDNLITLSDMEEDNRNWRPSLLVFSGNPSSRNTLGHYAVWFESGRGIVMMSHILVGKMEKLFRQKEIAERQLKNFFAEFKLRVFPHVVIAPDIATGIETCLQGTAIGPLRPNLVMFGWPENRENARAVLEQCRNAALLQMGQILIRNRGLPDPERDHRRIDVWWRGRKNGSLMTVLAHLLLNNYEWHHTSIRVLRLVESEEGVEPAMQNLQQLLDEARLSGQAQALVSDRPFNQIIRENSGDADLVMLGFEIPEPGKELEWLVTYEKLLEWLPTVAIVHCARETDLLD